MNNGVFRILSLDGGGVRGVFQAAFLVKLHDHLAAKGLGTIANNFELIAGTSTGAIMGMALALEVDPHRILEFYRREAANIFARKGTVRNLVSYVTKGPRYDAAKLRELLAGADLFETKQLGQAKTKVIITASSLNRFDYRAFTNIRELESNDDNLSAVDVVVASAAAPTYFTSHRPQGEEVSYVDGGLWANSPSLIAVLAANKRLNKPLECIRLLSIATGDFPRGITSDAFDDLRPVGQIDLIFEIMFSCQSRFADDYATWLLGEPNAIRVSTPLEKMMPLDDAEAAISQLPALAEIAAQKSLGKVLKMLIREPKPEIQGEIDIMGRWQAAWHFEDGTIFANDEVTLTRWLNDTRFEGYGEVIHHDKKYKYSISGEVSRARVVVLIYKAERFPTEASIGTACLELGDSATDMNGYWSGRASSLQNDKKIYTVRGGKVQMRKMVGL
jgi:uncharacterized protein